MPPVALSPFWNDFYAAGGFYLGVVGFGVGAAGLWATYWQVRETKRAAVAAREAATQTLRETKQGFRRLVAGFAHRFLAEARAAVENETWAVAALRTNDVADLLAQLPADESRLRVAAESLRKFARSFAQRARDPTKAVSLRKWDDELIRIQGILDREQSLFADGEGASL